jgi:organic hydroperoxide reductase OsmC/OhrA
MRLVGGPSGYGQLSDGALPVLQSAPPPQFDGPGDAWSPEHLLLAAVETCFLFTFRATARSSMLDFERLDIEAAGTVDRDGGVTHFTEIVLHPRLIVPPGVDRGRALQVLEKSEKRCLVSASLSTPVRLEPEVHEGDPRELVGRRATQRSSSQ